MSKEKLFPWILVLMLVLGAIMSPLGAASAPEETEIRVIDPTDGDTSFIFSTDTTPVGTRFNATVWVYEVTDLYNYQIRLSIDDTLLSITRAWIPNWDLEWIFHGQAMTFAPSPLFEDADSDGSNEAVTLGCTLLGNIPGVDGTGLLAIVEFEILYAPLAGETATCDLNIDDPETFIENSNLENMDFTPVNGYYEISAPSPVERHDIAVTAVSAFPTSVFVGDPVSIEVTVENQGDFYEEFSVTAYYDENEVGTQAGSLNPGDSHTFTFTWDTTDVMPGSYVIKATASLVGDEDPEDNTRIDGTVRVTKPVVGKVEVDWANYSTKYYPCGDPRYPFGGKYHNGEYPVWKNFSIKNGADEKIVYISVKYPDTTPKFKPAEYEIRVIPNEQCWTIKVNFDDRLIEFIAEEDAGIPPGGCAIVSIKFIEGPTEEDCEIGHEFAVHVAGITCYAQTTYLKEYIDKTPPNVEITFPDATSPADNYAFIKRKDGNIWLLLPNCSDRNVRWLWINGTASDSCSGINRVEIWINGTYMGDAQLSGPIGSKSVSWWWYTDPTKNPDFWKDESWYYVVARAYDNSVNDEKTVPPHGSHPRIPKTNFRDTPRHWFFWIGVEGPVVIACENYKPVDWVPGNGRLDVWGKTGFYPNTEVEIWLENELYGFKKLLTTVMADNYGRFYVTINHLPEVPRKPTCSDRWVIRAVQPTKNLERNETFAIIPWITFEDTLAQDNPRTWQTTKKGHVGDTIMVYGHGFLPSRHPEWDPYSTVYVRVVYTEVAPPLEPYAWTYRRVFNGTSQYNWDNLEWYPKMSEVVLAEVQTDENGYWCAEITIPQSYGGLHAIYAYEYKLVTDRYKPGPETSYVLVESGWTGCTGVEKEAQAAIFDVWPTIEVSPHTAITSQYVTIYGEGLPLPKYYELWINDESVYLGRDWCFVLDFGPREQWVFENRFIRNNEFDSSWLMGLWYPFSFYLPDPAWVLDSPVWSGKLCSLTFDYPDMEYYYELGSKYLKVPMLPPGTYDVHVYYFDKDTESFTCDHDATTDVNVIKDPLNIRVEVGPMHFPDEIVSVFVRTDVDGTLADITELSLKLYKGDTFIRELSWNRIDVGCYIATFQCPEEEGDYFITASASKTYDSTMTLHGSTSASFIVSSTLNGLNAILTEIQGDIAILKTDVGTIKVSLEALEAQLTSIQGELATLNTAIGTIQVDIDTISATITSIEGRIVTIETSLGTIETDISNINGNITSIKGRMVTIETSIDTVKTDISNINGRIDSIEGRILTVETDLGQVKLDIQEVNGKIANFDGEFVLIETDLGNVKANLTDINTKISINAQKIATIETDIGTIKGKLISIEDKIATIETDVGTIKANTSSIKMDTGLQPASVGLSLVAAIAAIVAIALIVRKIYLK